MLTIKGKLVVLLLLTHCIYCVKLIKSPRMIGKLFKFFLHLSLRQLHVMDETYVINQVKEDVCYVSQDFYKDMELAQ